MRTGKELESKNWWDESREWRDRAGTGGTKAETGNQKPGCGIAEWRNQTEELENRARNGKQRIQNEHPNKN